MAWGDDRSRSYMRVVGQRGCPALLLTENTTGIGPLQRSKFLDLNLRLSASICGQIKPECLETQHASPANPTEAALICGHSGPEPQIHTPAPHRPTSPRPAGARRPFIRLRKHSTQASEQQAPPGPTFASIGVHSRTDAFRNSRQNKTSEQKKRRLGGRRFF